jgi:hypothetical protein
MLLIQQKKNLLKITFVQHQESSNGWESVSIWKLWDHLVIVMATKLCEEA